MGPFGRLLGHRENAFESDCGIPVFSSSSLLPELWYYCFCSATCSFQGIHKVNSRSMEDSTVLTIASAWISLVAKEDIKYSKICMSCHHPCWTEIIFLFHCVLIPSVPVLCFSLVFIASILRFHPWWNRIPCNAFSFLSLFFVQ
jgi:hypothetical protein